MPVTPKVALVIDALPAMGGAEKVLMAALDLFPQAPIYTLFYNRSAFAGTPIARRQVIASPLERFPFVRAHYRKLLPLMPTMIRRFDLRAYDQVVSFSYAVAHGVRTRPGQVHFSYTYTPMRYAWRGYRLNGEQHPGDQFLNFVFQSFRKWDGMAASRVDRFAAVSQWIASLVQRVYRRQAEVIYPPVEIERFTPQVERGGYYISVARLVPHKRIDLIVAAFNRLKLPLLVVGEGPERERLEKRALSNVHFLGYQSEQDVARLLGRARGFVCAAEEDFGIAMVEAQAAGCPVIAYRKGGGLETILEGRSGLFFDGQSSQEICDAVLRCEGLAAHFNPLDIAAGALRFNKERFLQEFAAFTGTIPTIPPQFPLPAGDSMIFSSSAWRTSPGILGEESYGVGEP